MEVTLAKEYSAIREALLHYLGLKEAINNKVHFEHCFINELDIKKICQENLKMCNIIEFFRNKLLGRVAW